MNDIIPVNRMDKIKFIIINFFLLLWIISVSKSSLKELYFDSLGPFHFMPPFYWISLLCTIILILYNLKTSNSNILKYFSLIVLGLMTFGTLAIIEPYGGGYPDAYVNVNVAELILHYGSNDFGADYPSVYPSFYIFMGSFQRLTGLSFEIVRFFPMLLMVLYLFGIAYLVNSITKYTSFKDNNSRIVIISLAFLCFTTFTFSLGIRTDPSPQTFAILLLPYFLGSFILFNLRQNIVSFILITALVSTHMMTSFFCIFMGLNSMLFVNKEYIYRIVLLCVAWMGWVTYISKNQLSFGLNYILKMWSIELDLAKGAGGLILPNSEIYVHIKLLSLIIYGFFLLLSIIYLIKEAKKLSLLLLGFVLITGLPIIFYILKGTSFLTRVFELTSIYVALIFGFGMYMFLSNFFKTEENIIYTKRNTNIEKSTTINKCICLFIIGLILSNTFFSLVTARQSDLLSRTTKSEICGYDFMLYNSDAYILSPILPPIQHLTEINYINRIVRAFDDDMKIDAYGKVSTFYGLIGLSKQWISRQQILEKKKYSSLEETIYVLDSKARIEKIYCNGNFAIYQIIP